MKLGTEGQVQCPGPAAGRGACPSVPLLFDYLENVAYTNIQMNV